jgi:Uncharacterized protein conserved in bacteria (DUF2330)
VNVRRLPCILVLPLLAAVVFTRPQPADACAVAPPRNKSVDIASETAIIVWDSAAKTQHFIRRASFNTEARDFGFLVPTPTKPTLAEADDKAFAELARITAPRVETQPRPSGGPSCGCAASKSGMAPEPDVRVLEEKRVAGYDAAVLEADSPGALGKWLKEHDYEFSPALSDWVAPYVKAGWKITAFKIAKDAPQTRDVATRAVRMTFQTERPFFPYREPAGQGAAPGLPSLPAGRQTRAEPRRLLRVFFLADKRFQGTLGEKGEAWPGLVAWANKVPADDREKVLKLLKLPAETPPASWWLTEFEDHSSPRPGTADVYFSASEDQTTVERPPHIKYVGSRVPDCLMCYALAAYMLLPCLVRHARRKRGGAA